jgi:hypothetical protein
MAAIYRDIPIEDLIKANPDAVGFLIRHGLPCVVCGEPFWGTLAELAGQKGWDSGRIDALVEEFNRSHQ